MARNKGVEVAQGKSVTFIDADDYWNDGYIEQSLDFLEAHSACVAVTVTCKNIASFAKAPVIILHGWMKPRKGEAFVIDDFFNYWVEYCHVGTCSTTLRKSAVVEAVPWASD